MKTEAVCFYFDMNNKEDVNCAMRALAEKIEEGFDRIGAYTDSDNICTITLLRDKEE